MGVRQTGPPAKPNNSLLAYIQEATGHGAQGEHGIGRAKRDYITRAIDPPTLELMRAIKRQFDPKGILNPGKVFPPV